MSARGEYGDQPGGEGFGGSSPVPTTVRLGERYVPLIRLGVTTADPAALTAALALAGLQVGQRPVVVLVGGADGLVTDDRSPWHALFRDGLVAGVVRGGACLVDGGTDSGVLALAGQARAAAAADYPSVGVVVEGTVRWPQWGPSAQPAIEPELADAAEIGPQHTHIVAVPGRQWGDGPPWISFVATILAGPAPSLTVVVNGGPITVEDVRQSLAAGRPVLLVAGTGRLADALTAAVRTPADAAPGLRALAESRLLRVVDGLADPEQLAGAIARLATLDGWSPQQ
jgi:hypothetical protein